MKKIHLIFQVDANLVTSAVTEKELEMHLQSTQVLLHSL